MKLFGIYFIGVKYFAEISEADLTGVSFHNPHSKFRIRLASNLCLSPFSYALLFAFIFRLPAGA
jgi:hypothetical protein